MMNLMIRSIQMKTDKTRVRSPVALLVLLACFLVAGAAPNNSLLGSFATSPAPKPSDEAEVRSALQRIFNHLKQGEYEALYESLPSSSRARMSRERFTSALQRTRDWYRLDRLEIGAVRVAGDFAVADTVMYAKPIEGDGKLVVQQYLVKEGGSWRVATGDRVATERFLKSNPSFARKFPIKRPRTFIKQNGNWVEIPLGRPRTGRPN
jgi:hypothetical protein